MITVTTKLCIKELAEPVGRSVSFLYKASAAGMPMKRDYKTKCLVSTPAEVLDWIHKNNFRIVKGRVKKGAKRHH